MSNVTDSEFSLLLKRAKRLASQASGMVESNWWVGYSRGLYKAHFGDLYGLPGEHESWLEAFNDPHPQRASFGQGYRAGLELREASPP